MICVATGMNKYYYRPSVFMTFDQFHLEFHFLFVDLIISPFVDGYQLKYPCYAIIQAEERTP